MMILASESAKFYMRAWVIWQVIG